jgi:hypothetical protein
VTHSNCLSTQQWMSINLRTCRANALWDDYWKKAA